MAKIRGIKPDYWTDEDIVELSIPARLLFIGMWNFACDNGHLADKPKQIKMRILPADDVNVAELLRELTTCGRITRDNGVITIVGLTRHQRVDHRYFSTCDAPGCTRPKADSQHKTRSAPAVRPASTRSAPAVVSSCTPGDGDGDGDGDYPLPPTAARRALAGKTSSADAEDDFETFWTSYPRKVGKAAARTAFLQATRDTPPDQITAGLLRGLPALTDTDNRFIPHPASWLQAGRWADEQEPEPDPWAHLPVVNGRPADWAEHPEAAKQ